jgi:hypothetical protein
MKAKIIAWGMAAAVAGLAAAQTAAAFEEDAAAVRNASGPALICDGQRKLYSYSSQLPQGSPVSPGRDVVAFVLDGASTVLRVTINRDNPAEMLVDRLPVVVFTSGSKQRVVALDANDLIGQARLYAISFDRAEVATGWGVAGYETQGGAGWYACRAAAPAEIVP